MIGYVTLGTNDLARGAKFYDAIAAELGTARMMEFDSFIAWGTPGGMIVGLGLAGALIGAFVITPPFAGRLATYGFSLPGLLISLLGSILLLALAILVLRRKARPAPPSGA